MVSPLAKRLFTIDGVQGIFFGADFVTVTKSDDTPWAVLKPDIYAAMMDHFSSGVWPEQGAQGHGLSVQPETAHGYWDGSVPSGFGWTSPRSPKSDGPSATN